MKTPRKDLSEAEISPEKSVSPRPTVLKSINKRRFLEELRKRGPSTRAELTRAIGVAPPTSSSIIADLMEAGFLEVGGGTQSLGKGRPGTFFRLASSTAFVIGATLDIAECRVAPSGLDGLPIAGASVSFPTPATYPELIETLRRSIQSVDQSASGRCLGVGLAVPGLLDSRKHRVAFSPNMHMLDGRDLGADLQLDTPFRVACTQEEHALCLSEQLQGATEGLADFAVVDFSSGVGMGVVSNGRYISGSHGYAGEVGHTTVDPQGLPCGCGNRGCLETVASDRALLNAIELRLGEKIGFDGIQERSSQSCQVVEEEIAKTLGYIAIGLATVVNLFNPRVIFVNGRIFNLGDTILTELNALVKSRALRPSFADVQLRTATGDKMHGAIAGILDSLFAEVGPRLD